LSRRPVVTRLSGKYRVCVKYTFVDYWHFLLYFIYTVLFIVLECNGA